MALTYLDTAMIEQPANIPYLSAGEFIATDATLKSANINTLSSYNFYANNILNNTDLFGNLTVYGGVTALSGITFVESFNTSTTALSVANVGVGPALYVFQDQNTAGVATFIGYGNQEILRVNNVEPDTGQATVAITKGQSNKSLSATGTSTFEDINGLSATITRIDSTNVVATSATVGTITGTTAIITTVDAGTIVADTTNTATANITSLTMPSDSYSYFGNITVYGEINALSGIANISSLISETSALSVVSIGDSPALYVQQKDIAGAVATFYANDTQIVRINNTELTPTDPAITVVGNISGNSVVYDAEGNSTNWNSVYTAVQPNSANWEGTYTAVQPNSANWTSTYTTFTNNSADYILDGGNTKAADLTVGTNDSYNLKLETNNTTRVIVDTSGNVGIGTATPNQKLTVVGTVSSTDIATDTVSAGLVQTDFSVLDVATDRTFSSSDKSKVFHFQTTTNNTLSAIFPDELLNGFNVGIVNAGTGTVLVSSTQTPFLCATGFKNTYPYSSITVYKHNNALFGLGAFD